MNEADIRDIKGLVEIPWSWEWWALGAVLALILVGLVWFLYRRRKKVQVKGAYERALEQFEDAKKYMQPEHSEKFSVEVSGALRSFIEEHFVCPSVRCTTEEFLDQVEQGKVRVGIKDSRGKLKEFLTLCDLAKFARGRLEQGTMHDMLKSAKLFVETAHAEEQLQVSASATSMNGTTPAPSHNQPSDLTQGGEL